MEIIIISKSKVKIHKIPKEGKQNQKDYHNNNFNKYGKRIVYKQLY